MEKEEDDTLLYLFSLQTPGRIKSLACFPLNFHTEEEK